MRPGLGVPWHCHVPASEFGIRGSYCHKDLNLLCRVFQVSAGFVFKTLACLPDAVFQNWQRVLAQHCPVLSTAPSGSLSSSPAFLGSFPAHLPPPAPALPPDSHAGRCRSPLLAAGTLAPAPGPRAFPLRSPCPSLQLHAQGPSFRALRIPPATTVSVYNKSPLPPSPRLIFTPHFVPSEKALVERSVQVPTDCPFILLHIFGKSPFLRAIYAGQRKHGGSLPARGGAPGILPHAL